MALCDCVVCRMNIIATSEFGHEQTDRQIQLQYPCCTCMLRVTMEIHIVCISHGNYHNHWDWFQPEVVRSQSVGGRSSVPWACEGVIAVCSSYHDFRMQLPQEMNY